MTDINRKRTLQQFIQGSQDEISTKPLVKVAPIKGKKKPLGNQIIDTNEFKGEKSDEDEHEIDKSLKKAQKVLKIEDDSKLVTLDSFRSAYDPSIISLYKIAEQRPKMFQKAVKSLLTPSNESSDQMQTLLQTCFLYFFQLLGIKEDDMASMDILFGHLKTAKR